MCVLRVSFLAYLSLGMSESGLARLCNVSRQSVSELLRNILSVKLEISPLKPLQRKDVWVQARNLDSIANSKISHISTVRAEICVFLGFGEQDLALLREIFDRTSSHGCGFCRFRV